VKFETQILSRNVGRLPIRALMPGLPINGHRISHARCFLEETMIPLMSAGFFVKTLDECTLP
jgi:hypothetical protein